MKTLKQLNDFSVTAVTYFDQALGAGRVLTNRYQINGLIDTSKPVLQNMEAITNSAASWLGYDIHEGRWGVVINQTGTSIASFNDSNILGSISVSGTGLKDLYNSSKATFPHRDLRDSQDFVLTQIATQDQFANEQSHTLGLTYDIINEPIQAQLLSLIELKQGRIDLVVNFRADYSYINLKAGDLIDVTDTRFSFTNKVFRIASIAEVQNDAGPLELEITALEYNSNVYSTADLYRYTRSDADGIITIGSIGAPGTPQVTKFEIDARPRVLVESTAPTGIVESMEFWISYDVLVAEENRTYTILGEVKPVNGGTFASGQTVRLDYDNLNSSNFVIKTRGKNSTTVGPYSSISGFTEFDPTQTTQAIGPDTKTIDSLGNIVTALAVIDLLKGVDGIYQKVANTSSMFTKIFETFKEYTGVDLVGEAQAGTVGAITIRDEGTTLTTTTTAINFIGGGVTAVNSGTTVNVTIPTGSGSFGTETWTTNTASSVTEIIDIDGVGVRRFKTIVFNRPTGDKVTLNITWP